jgi:hypothetical protein
MSPNPATSLNPSQAVERIREIIVSRHLDKLEQRVSLLESGSPLQGSLASQWEERLCTSETRLEALQESVHRLTESQREDSEIRSARQQLEIQRLASQILQVAVLKTTEATQPSIHRLESRLANWQSALQTHLTDREARMSSELRQEVATLLKNTEARLTRSQCRAADQELIEEKFSHIAAAPHLTSSTLTPLPSPHPGIAAASAAAKSWNVLPFPRPRKLSASAPQPSRLPAIPDRQLPGSQTPAKRPYSACCVP